MRALPGELPIVRGEPLAPRTTLGLGGPAELFLEAGDEATLRRALAWADAGGVPLTILGGGSNVIVPDEGVAGLVLVPAMRGVAIAEGSERVRVRAAAGEPWDAFVERTVAQGLAGLECLSGIPGLVGATPIQNVGAYGVETSDVIAEVEVLDRSREEVHAWAPAACGFAYRDSVFKREPARFVVLGATFALRRGAPAAPRYTELARALPLDASLAEVRRTVIALRRAKGMVLDPADPDGRSAGSFFTNPIVSAEVAVEVRRRALARGLVSEPTAVPSWPAEGGRVKLAAGWLVEKSGVAKGERRGAVGVSGKHALALVHHGGGRADELLAFAADVRARVLDAFGVALEREPVVLSARPGS